MFANRKNIKDVQTQVSTVLRQFRFKEAHYLWYSGDDEHQYYEIAAIADGDISKNLE